MPGGFVLSWVGRVAVVVLALLAVGAAGGTPATAAVMWHPKPVLLPTPVRRNGLSGAIYTQTTDVENEVNGFLSYDRWVVKMTIPVVAERNRVVIAAGTPGLPAPPDVRR